MMKKVNVAFEELSDEDKRRKYDSEQHSYDQGNWYYQSYQSTDNNQNNNKKQNNSSYIKGWYEEF